MNTIVKEESVIEAPQSEEVVIESAPQPGEKTESALLLKSLQEERDKRRELERTLEELERVQQPIVDIVSDEGRLLKGEIERLEGEIRQKEAQHTLSQLQVTYPALKDKTQEFEDFRASTENAGMKLETAAKAFLVERNLLETPVTRKGLEKDTGGGRVQPKQGRTQEEVTELRTTNFRQYIKELKAGTLYG